MDSIGSETARINFLKVTDALNRPGVKKLTDYLQNETDFFTAPASASYHLNFPGGLALHSFNVYRELFNIMRFKGWTIKYGESIPIISLFHDVCKAGCYKTVDKWRKDENGKWESYKTYAWDDNFPFGHGEKSVHIIGKYIDLTNDEALAIRWHMGAHDITAKDWAGSKQLTAARIKSPLVTALHLADMEATWFDETKY